MICDVIVTTAYIRATAIVTKHSCPKRDRSMVYGILEVFFVDDVRFEWVFVPLISKP